jgi:uncharacterized protein YbaR (Trm112 family)
MRERFMEFLICPQCRGELSLHPLDRGGEKNEDIETGILRCGAAHAYPITGGIPRMLPDSIAEHARAFDAHLPRLSGILTKAELDAIARAGRLARYDRRTKANFSLEWRSFQPVDGTWTMTPAEQVQGYFVNPLRAVDASDWIRDGAVFFDAGCGPGLPSLGYGELGFEVVALDLSTGLEHGEAQRRQRPSPVRDRVHFVQGDLFHPPLRFGIADVVSSLGVISSTPSTKAGFDSIARVLKPEGVFSVWVYAYERGVTEVVNALRIATTRVPPPVFAGIATAAAPAFQAFCWFTSKTGLRPYGRLSRGAARIALMDIFGAPYVHAHSFEEVDGWFREHGFQRTARVAVSRRGFGAIGVRGGRAALRPTPSSSRVGEGARA